MSKAVDDSGRSKKKTKIKEEHDSDNEEALALMTTQEELPQVAGIVDDSRLKTRFTTGNWQDAFKVKEEPLSDDDEAPQHPKYYVNHFNFASCSSFLLIFHRLRL